MLVVHKRKAHTALEEVTQRAVELLCSEQHSLGQNFFSCFNVLLNKFLGWEICYVFFPLFALAGFLPYTRQWTRSIITILKFLRKQIDVNIDNLVKMFDKVIQSYNNSLESWNKGLTVCYTILPAVKDTFTYEWEITDVLTNEGMCLPCHFAADKDPETQICANLNTLKQLMSLSK